MDSWYWHLPHVCIYTQIQSYLNDKNNSITINESAITMGFPIYQFGFHGICLYGVIFMWRQGCLYNYNNCPYQVPYWVFVFLLLAIINKVAVNVHMLLIEWISYFISFRSNSKSAIVGSYGSYMTNFWGIPKLYSIMAASFYININNVWKCQSFPFLSNFLLSIF